MAKKKPEPAQTPFELRTGDCFALMPLLFEDRKADLVVTDPPYNYGEPYDKYHDKKPWNEYMAWTKAWLAEMADHVLAPHASVFLFYPDELVSWVDVFCQETLGWHKRSHIVWAYTFGVCNSAARNFSRSHTHILYYTRKKTKFHFDAREVMIPSARSLAYKDKRAASIGKVPDNTWCLLRHQLEEMLPHGYDTWLESRVCGTYKEKQDTPNQLPLPLVERIVKVASKPGDLVFDPFSGSGTTGAASVTNGRPFVGCDLSAEYNANARKRIEAGLASGG